MPNTTSWRTHRSELSSLFWSILYGMTFAADLWIQIWSDPELFDRIGSGSRIIVQDLD